jgi:hypothetical protein
MFLGDRGFYKIYRTYFLKVRLTQFTVNHESNNSYLGNIYRIHLENSSKYFLIVLTKIGGGGAMQAAT